MGTFLSLTSAVGKSQTEVADSLRNYARSVGGGLEKKTLSIEQDNCCVLEEANGHTTIVYPSAYLAWDETAAALSRDLQAPVFSFHIHDGDFWMYLLFVNGETVDQFNPIPDYWDEDISKEETDRWKGNAATVCKHLRSVMPAAIKQYLVRWDPDAEESEKAYPDDEFAQEDWQLLDFLRKAGLPYPLNDDGSPKGQTYALWTKDLPLAPLRQTVSPTVHENVFKKPWWKLW